MWGSRNSYFVPEIVRVQGCRKHGFNLDSFGKSWSLLPVLLRHRCYLVFIIMTPWDKAASGHLSARLLCGTSSRRASNIGWWISVYIFLTCHSPLVFSDDNCDKKCVRINVLAKSLKCVIIVIYGFAEFQPFYHVRWNYRSTHSTSRFARSRSRAVSIWCGWSKHFILISHQQINLTKTYIYAASISI